MLSLICALHAAALSPPVAGDETGSSTSLAHPPALRLVPLVGLQIDGRSHSARAEGEDGFAIARGRLGARAWLGDRAFAVLSFEAARERPGIIDGFLTWLPRPWLEVTAGYARSALLAIGRAPVFTLPINERTPFQRAFWPGRDVGLEGHLLPIPAPVELWARVGNGSDGVLGNEFGGGLSGELRADLVLGRGRAQAAWRAPSGLTPGLFADRRLGGRVGLGARLERAGDRHGIRGLTSTGFLFHRAPPIIGRRRVAHATGQLWAGPLNASVELATARESRSIDTDGNPATPRQAQPAITSTGAAAELAWAITGEHRVPDAWLLPNGRDPWTGRGLELAVRGERLWLSRGARDVAGGGAAGGSAALTAYLGRSLSISAQGHVLRYDRPPIELPGERWSWVALLRTTVSLR